MSDLYGKFHKSNSYLHRQAGDNDGQETSCDNEGEGVGESAIERRREVYTAMPLEDSVNKARGRVRPSQYRIRGVGGVHISNST